ncbi:hypothetical protein IQ260_05255, partial [Leptolyngbya cf. ectocarpi LEGE 11479]
MENQEPIIQLDPAGKAPILSYSVPENTAYSGRNYIELDIPFEYFDRPNNSQPGTTLPNGFLDADVVELEKKIYEFAKGQSIDPDLKIAISPEVKTFLQEKLRFLSPLRIEQISSISEEATLPVDEVISPFTTEQLGETPQSQTQQNEKVIGHVAQALINGERLITTTNFAGQETIASYPVNRSEYPKLILIETYRLSSYRGNYGAGEVIKTFSLLPGEKTKISVQTYKKSEQDSKTASSIFDSFNKESATSFEDSVKAEQTNKSAYKKSFGYQVKASAEVNFGFGKAAVSAGVKGSSNSSRDRLSKNVSNAVSKHAAKASSKRNVQVNSSYEVNVKTGEETEIIREIENVNVSRTLSFVFRQMNQEYITVFHLTDVRLGYDLDGNPENYQELSVSEMDGLLSDVIVSDKRETVKNAILDELRYIVNYKDELQSFVEEKEIKDESNQTLYSYWRLKKGDKSIYRDSGFEIEVPGIILDVSKNTLRTDGIIVDAILGQGNA